MSAEGPRFAIQYGVLEETLATLFDIPRSGVRSRFRKLRAAGFPDDIRTGSGSRVEYDFPRVMAFAAVFALADGFASQNEAVRIVQSTWPEWCRAIIAAAVDENLFRAKHRIPEDCLSTIWIAPDGLADRARSLIVASTSSKLLSGSPAIGRLVVDMAPLVRPFVFLEVAEGALALSLLDMEAAFGWDYIEDSGDYIRARKPWSVRDKPPRGSFLKDGPYYERASAFLDAVETQPLSPSVLWRLRVLSEYFQNPASTDRWKGLVGPQTSPGLNELLLIIGCEAGISELTDPLTIIAGAHLSGDPVSVARGLIDMAQRVRGSGSRGGGGSD